MKKQLPQRIYLEITKQCPNSCRHCYILDDKEIKEELKTNEIKNLIDQIKESGIKNFLINGGDPLTRSDIFDVLSYCNLKGLNTSLFVSESLINKEIIKELKKLNISIKLSLEGVKEQIHDYIRGEGSFKKLMNVIDALKAEHMADYSIHFTINRQNIKELLSLPGLLTEIKPKDVYISTIKPVGNALKNADLLIDPDLIPLIKSRYEIITNNKNLNFKIHKDKNWGDFGCPAAFNKFGITSYGDVTPCCFLGDTFTGKNIREHSLIDLWQHDDCLQSLRNLQPNTTCQNCDKLKVFNGGCRARALYYSSNIKGTDPYCCEIKSLQDNFNNIQDMLKWL